MTIKLSNSDDAQRIQIFKALADESRLEILRILKKSGKEMSCGEVGEHCNLHKATASYHFKTLREAGLTTTRKDSTSKYVQLNHETFKQFLPSFLETL